MSDEQLMKAIGQKWGVAIDLACRTSAVPPAFLAGLVANESGGNPNASRFEPRHFGEILEVCVNQRKVFDPPGIKYPLSAPDFLAVLDPSTHEAGALAPLAFALKKTVELATSWGLTQIMGWHCIELQKPDLLPTRIQMPTVQLSFTVDLLAAFAETYKLDVKNNLDELAACWNSGTPDPKKTYDPSYVSKVLARKALYEQFKSP